jgi:hypothetical protein
MPDDKKQDFLALYNKLPEPIQDFLASDEMGKIIDDALNLTKISSEQAFFSIMDLLIEILSLQLPQEQFKNELQQRIKTTAAETQIISQIIQTKIFNRFSKELNQYKPQLITPEEKIEKQTSPQKILPRTIPSFTPVFENKTLESSEKDTTKKQLKKIPPLIERVEKDSYEKSVFESKPQEQKQSIGGGKKEHPQKEIKSIEKPNKIIKKQTQDITEDITEYSFPEPSEIKVEKSIDKIGELKKVIAPKATPTQQDKIRQKLMEAMAKKDAQPKVVTEMKNVLQAKKSEEIGKREDEEKTTKQKPITTIEASTIVSGQGEEFKEEQVPQKSTTKKPYVLDVKLKETQEEKKRQEIAPEPVKYKKYKKESPFGKA